MEDLFLIAVTIAIGIPIGTLLFFPIRWLMLRNAPDEVKNHKVKATELVGAGLIVCVFLTLLWYMSAGSMVATIAFFVLAVVAHIAGLFVLQSTRKGNDA